MRPILLALGLFVSIQAQAVSLADAVERAWARHPQAKSQLEREAALSAEFALSSQLFPSAPSVTLSHQTDRYSRNAGAREFEAEVAIPLWLPGQRSAATQAAQSNMTAYSSEQAALRLQIAGEVREAVWRVALAENAAEVARRRLTSVQQIESDVMRRVSAGDLARADLLLAKVETSNARAALAEAEQLVLEARQQYLVLVGDDAIPTAQRELVTATTDGDAHPLLVAARERLAAAHARARLVGKSTRDNPELALALRRERGDAGEAYGNQVGVSIKIPLGSNAANSARIANAQGDVTEAEAHIGRQRLALAQEVRKAEAELQRAALRAELANNRHALAQENFQLSQKAFSLGEQSLFDFQRIQNALAEASLAAGQAAIELDRAHSRLKQALGVLP